MEMLDWSPMVKGFMSKITQRPLGNFAKVERQHSENAPKSEDHGVSVFRLTGGGRWGAKHPAAMPLLAVHQMYMQRKIISPTNGQKPLLIYIYSRKPITIIVMQSCGAREGQCKALAHGSAAKVMQYTRKQDVRAMLSASTTSLLLCAGQLYAVPLHGGSLALLYIALLYITTADLSFCATQDYSVP